MKQEAWDALCDNRDPNTGLAADGCGAKTGSSQRWLRLQLSRPQECLSALHAYTGSSCLLDAFREVPSMKRWWQWKSEMQTRLRRNAAAKIQIERLATWPGVNLSISHRVRSTGFPTHIYRRPTASCITSPSTELKIAGKPANFAILNGMPHTLRLYFIPAWARRIAELGLPIERTKQGWEIEGFGKSTLDTLSPYGR